MIRRWILIDLILVLSIVQVSIGDVSPNLKGWWKLDETSGYVVTDSSGHGNHGFVIGSPTSVEGMIDRALRLDGNDDYIDCGSGPSLNITGQVTVAAWIKLSATNLDQQIAGNISNQGGYLLNMYTNNKLDLIILSSGGQYALNRDVAGGTVMTTDVWYHVVGVYSQGNYIRTYVDGALDRESATATVLAPTPETFKIGRYPPQSILFWNGVLDDVRVYNRALSEAEIQSLALVGTNDECGFAEPIGEVTELPFDTRDATFDGPGHCMESPNIWYCYTATCTGIATVSLCGSDYDTKLAVYQGCGCYPSAIDLIRCNDDFCSYRSQVSFGVVTGNKYLIEIGGFEDKTGQGIMNITCEPAFCPPANDDCSNAQPIGDIWQQPFDIRCATFDGPGDCMDGANIWYRYTASCTGIVTVSTCGSDFDTVVAVYDGHDCSLTQNDLIECNDDYDQPGCDDQSLLTFTAIEGQQYLVEVGGYNDETSQGVLSITCQDFVPPPPPVLNDDCFNARPVGDVTNLSFDTSKATFDGPGNCMTGSNIWYCYTATCTGNATVSLCGSNYDTMLAVYDGCDCPTSYNIIDCDDDSCDRQSQISFAVTAGNQYLIEVGGYRQVTGQGVLSISCEGEAPSLLCQDLNGDGKVDFDDLVALILKWLEGCL